MTTETDDEILARFWSKTKADPATGCIQWYGTVNDLNDGIFFGWQELPVNAIRLAA